VTSASPTSWNLVPRQAAWQAIGLLLRPLHLGIAFPSILYLTALTVFLFRPPDLDLLYADRIVFFILLFFVALKFLGARGRIPFLPAISIPMLSLIALSAFRALREPFDASTWSLVASKFVVPFVLMHLAILVFRNPAERRQFSIFLLLALAYLVFTSIVFLADARTLIFPRFILDESIGHHVDRARGPFLQAVANGLSLNMLGILVLVFARRYRKIVLLLWLALPVAILATMTRAVWISFAASTVLVSVRLRDRCLRRACMAAVLAGVVVFLLIAVNDTSRLNSLYERFNERGPVDARLAVYEAGWAMFQEHPLTGWTAGRMYTELARRMQGYHLSEYYVHNTFLALLVEFGLPGLLLYGILLVGLFRLARADCGGGAVPMGAVSNLRKTWPILLGVFLVNACFVDMVYQFVNGLLFTVAGILCASRESA